MAEGETLNKIGKGAFVFILGVIFSKFFGLFYKVLVARTGPYNYGVLSLGIGVFGIFGAISTMGLDWGVTKYVAYYRNKMDTPRIKGIITSALKLSFIVAFLLSVFGFIMADVIAQRIFHNPDLTIVLRIFMLAVPFDAMRRIFIGTTKAFQHVKYETYSRDLIENIIKLSLTIIVVILGASLLGLSIAFIGGILASFIAVVYFTEKNVFSIFKTKIVSIKPYWELFNYSWPLMFTALLFMLSLWTDSLLIGYFKDAATVGIFNAAGPIAFLVYQLPSSLMVIFLPIITDLRAKGDSAGVESVHKTVSRWIFITGLMAVAGMAIFSKELIDLIFGNNYLLASTPLIILAIGYFINSFIFSGQRILMAFDKTRLIFVDITISFSLNILLGILLIPRYGLIGAAVSTALSFILLSIITLIQTRYVLKLKTFEMIYFRQAIPVLMSSGLIFALKDFFQGLLFILGLLLIPALSLALIYITHGFNENEIIMAKAVISKIKKN